MNESTMKKFKVFWAWQDEQEEAWLREMSLQGLPPRANASIRPRV